MEKITRCAWVPTDNQLYQTYHDEEWGTPVYDDRILFEFLTLEGAQAGLSWDTILKKRKTYREVFHSFNIKKVATLSDAELEKILKNPGIVRNRLKVFSTRKNAKVVLHIQKEFGSFSNYVWGFVQYNTIKNHFKSIEEIPTSTPESNMLSKDLKKRGCAFVGPTIMYAFMQAVGLVSDHTTDCFKYANGIHKMQIV